MNENNTHYEELSVSGTGRITNLGCVEHWDYKTYDPNKKLQQTADMGFKEGLEYDFSCYIKNVDFDGTVQVYLDGDKNPVSAYQLDISNTQADWRKIETTLKSAATEDGGLTIEFSGTGTLYMDFVQLIPHDAYGYGQTSGSTPRCALIWLTPFKSWIPPLSDSPAAVSVKEIHWKGCLTGKQRSVRLRSANRVTTSGETMTPAIIISIQTPWATANISIFAQIWAQSRSPV